MLPYILVNKDFSKTRQVWPPLLGTNITQQNPTPKLVTTQFEMNATVSEKVQSGCWETT